MECRVDGVFRWVCLLSTWCNRREARSRSAGSITRRLLTILLATMPPRRIPRRQQCSTSPYANLRHSGWLRQVLLGWIAVASATAVPSSTPSCRRVVHERTNLAGLPRAPAKAAGRTGIRK